MLVPGAIEQRSSFGLRARSHTASVLIALGIAVTAAFGQSDLAAPPAPPPPMQLTTQWFPSPTAADREVERRLDTVISQVDFRDTPLSAVVEWLNGHAPLPVRADWIALESANAPRDLKVTFRAANLELRHVLEGVRDAVRGEAAIDFLATPTEILITSEGELESVERSITRDYPINDLLAFEARWRPRFCLCGRPYHDPANTYCWFERHADYLDGAARDLLRDMLTQTARLDSWADYGGTATAAFQASTLVVRGSARLHNEVAELLTTLREAATAADARDLSARSRRAAGTAGPAVSHAAFVRRTASEQRFEKGLGRLISATSEARGTFPELLARISEAADVPIHVRYAYLEACEFDLKRVRSVRLGGTTPRAVLRQVTREASTPELRFGWRVAPWGVMVGTEWDSQRETMRVYPVQDLLLAYDAQRRTDTPAPTRASDDDDSSWSPQPHDVLADTVTGFVKPDRWMIAGGTGSLAFFGPLLVTRQSIDDSDPVETLLDALAQSLAAPKPSSAPARMMLTTWYPAPTAAEVEVDRALDAVVPEVSFAKGSLKDIERWVRGQVRLPVRLDERILTGYGVPLDATASYRVRNLELRHVLAGVCAAFPTEFGRVQYRATPDELFIRHDSSEWSSAEDFARCYPVGDLLDFEARWRSRFCRCDEGRHNEANPGCWFGRRFQKWDADSQVELVEAITSSVFPDAWQVSGGTSSAMFYGPTLVVRAWPAHQALVVDFLTALREAAAAVDSAASASRATTSPDVQQPASAHAAFHRLTAAERRFEAALEQVAPEVRFEETSLKQLLAFVSTQTGVPILVDWAGLEAAGIERDKPMSVRIGKLPFDTLLSMILREAGGPDVHLSYELHPWGIRVALADRIACSTRVYVVADVLTAIEATLHPPEKRTAAATSDTEPEWYERGRPCASNQLRTAITEGAAPDSWAVNGGNASLAFFGPLMVVWHSYGPDDPVERFLDTLASPSRE